MLSESQLAIPESLALITSSLQLKFAWSTSLMFNVANTPQACPGAKSTRALESEISRKITDLGQFLPPWRSRRINTPRCQPDSDARVCSRTLGQLLLKTTAPQANHCARTRGASPPNGPSSTSDRHPRCHEVARPSASAPDDAVVFSRVLGGIGQ